MPEVALQLAFPHRCSVNVSESLTPSLSVMKRVHHSNYYQLVPYASGASTAVNGESASICCGRGPTTFMSLAEGELASGLGIPLVHARHRRSELRFSAVVEPDSSSVVRQDNDLDFECGNQDKPAARATNCLYACWRLGTDFGL